jgi:hypothetical protein
VTKSYVMPEAHTRTSNPSWLPGVLALALCVLLLINWLSPVGFRLNERSFDGPVLFGTLFLLSAWAIVKGRQFRPSWQSLLVRLIGVSIFVLAIPAGCTSLFFRVAALPVAHISYGSDRVTAYWMTGGAVGPHYTEFREERPIVPGLLLARVVGYSPYIGEVTLSVSHGNTFRAVVSDGPRGASPDLFECSVTALLPW